MNIKPHSDEAKKKISESMKGIIRSDETKKKMSESKKGNKPFLGKHHSDKSKIKMSVSKKNISDETRNKMSESKKGNKNPNYGKPLSDETKKKMSVSKKKLKVMTKIEWWKIKFNDWKKDYVEKGEELDDETMYYIDDMISIYFNERYESCMNWEDEIILKKE